jgi:DNA-binding PadR family transcriptional regulator
MTEQTFLILTSLAGGPRHGYGVILDVEQISAGRVVLRAGTLYGALDRLGEEGLVELDREEVEAERLRRYYRLTGEGRAALATEATRLTANAKAATRRLRAATS